MKKMLLIIPAVVTMAGIGYLLKKNGWHFWREKTLKEAWLEKKVEGEEDEDDDRGGDAQQVRRR